MGKGEYGARLVFYGLDSWFLPWYWGGDAVWYGPPMTTQSDALEWARKHAALT